MINLKGESVLEKRPMTNFITRRKEHETKYGGSPRKVFSDQDVWKVASNGDVRLRAATPSQSPTIGNILQR